MRPSSTAVSDFDEALVFERAQKAAHIAGIEAQFPAQSADVRPAGADLENHPRLAERPAAPQIALLQRADALGDEAVEAPNLIEPLAVHSLTIVRELRNASPWRDAGLGLTADAPFGDRVRGAQDRERHA